MCCIVGIRREVGWILSPENSATTRSLPTPLTGVITGGVSPIDCRRGQSGGANHHYGGQALLLHAEGDRIAIERNYEVNVLRRIRQRSLPQTFAIRGRF